MQRSLSNILRWPLFVLLMLSPCAAHSQTRPPAPDPTTNAINKAMQDGRFADAEKILITAIQQMEQEETKSARLSLYLKRLANLLMRKENYTEAVALTQRALEIDREVFGPDSSRVAGDLSNLALLYDRQRKTDAAEGFFKQALEIARRNQNIDARSTLSVINNFTGFYLRQRRWAETEALLLEARKVCESQAEPQTSPCLPPGGGLLAEVYRKQGKVNEAEQLIAESVRKSEGAGKDATEMAHGLISQGHKFESEKNYSEAERLYRQAIALYEKNEEPDDPLYLPDELYRLGQVLEKQGQKTEAEKVYLRALELEFSAASPKRPDLPTVMSASGLLNLYRAQGRLREMEPIFRRLLETQERLLGPRHANVAFTILMLAEMYAEQQKYFEARPLFERALAIQEKNMGPDHPGLIGALSYYAALLRKTKEDELAAEIEARIKAIQKKSQRPDRPQ